MVAVVGPVLQGYRDLLTLARDLAERAAAGGRLEPADLMLHRQMFETVEAQLASAQTLLQMMPREPIHQRR
jgi:hypothetical protein